MIPHPLASYEIYVTPDRRDLDAYDAALEAAGYLDVPGAVEWVWPLTDWWRLTYAQLHRTPAPCGAWWR